MNERNEKLGFELFIPFVHSATKYYVVPFCVLIMSVLQANNELPLNTDAITCVFNGVFLKISIFLEKGEWASPDPDFL